MGQHHREKTVQEHYQLSPEQPLFVARKLQRKLSGEKPTIPLLFKHLCGVHAEAKVPRQNTVQDALTVVVRKRQQLLHIEDGDEEPLRHAQGVPFRAVVTRVRLLMVAFLGLNGL